MTKLQLTFTPGANKTYLLVASCLVKLASTGQNILVELTDGTTNSKRGIRNDNGMTAAPHSIRIGQVYAAPGSPSSRTWTLQFYASSATPVLTISEARIVAIELGPNDLTSSAASVTSTTSATPQTKTSLTLVAGSSYLLVGSMGAAFTSGVMPIATSVAKMRAGSTDYGAQNPWRQGGIGAALVNPFHAEAFYAAAGADTVSLMWSADGTASAQCGYAYLVALEVGSLPQVFQAESRAEVNTGSSADQDLASVTFNVLPGDFLVVETGVQKATNSSASAASMNTHLTIDGVADTSEQEGTNSSSDPGYSQYGSWRVLTLTAGVHTVKSQYNAGASGTVTAYVKENAVFVVQLADDLRPAPPLVSDRLTASAYQPVLWGV